MRRRFEFFDFGALRAKCSSPSFRLGCCFPQLALFKLLQGYNVRVPHSLPFSFFPQRLRGYITFKLQITAGRLSVWQSLLLAMHDPVLGSGLSASSLSVVDHLLCFAV